MKYQLMGLACALAWSVHADKVFKAQDGLLIMEVESTGSSRGDWEKKTSIEGFTGTCHFEFTGNKPAGGPAQDPLEYSFTVDKDGVYDLMIRCHKRLEDEEPDKCNDCYVRLEGDFESAGPTPMNILEKDTKLFGGSAKGWGWTAKLDVQHKKWPAVYQFKAGEKYTLIVSGRSRRFNMDRIIFKHKDVNMGKARNPETPESPAE
jgi:hypothetical protein